jgi:hypothetical protein
MAVVEKYMPGLASDPLIGESQRMSLRQVAAFSNLPAESVAALDKELRQLSE